jgi:hypothetical protein
MVGFVTPQHLFSNVRLADHATSCVIVSFRTDELVLKSARGETATFDCVGRL